MSVVIRPAAHADLEDVRRIYNQGIADRCTLDRGQKSALDIAEWFAAHDDRYAVLVAERGDSIAGWAALNRYSLREAHWGVADLSIYVDRALRGQGVGSALMVAIEDRAVRAAFDKIVLMTFPFNREGRLLFARNGFQDVGIFKNQGRLDGRLVDTLAMEKLLSRIASDAEAG